MNKNLDNESLSDRRFDRLVDGELNEEERREMLAGLDREPGGWRRCALAFLESQCWKQTFGAFSQQTVQHEAPVTVAHSAPVRGPGRMGTLLAMAASFLIALWVGSLVWQTGTDRVAAPPGATGGLASVSPKGSTPSDPWRVVTVSQPTGAQAAGHSLRVPAVERNNIDPQWARNLPAPIPDEVMRAFNRTGHRVQQRREFVPVPLKDGRQLVVPVDQVDVHYVGDKTY